MAPCREFASAFVDMAQDTFSGIVANAVENTRFLSDPQVKQATGNIELQFPIRMMAEPTTVYLVIPPQRIATQRTWLRLVITAMTGMYKRVPMANRAPHRCMFLIDEFPALGRMPDIPSDIATMAGYGVDYTLVVQGLDQLKDHYKEAAATILSNCAFKWFCNVNDLDSAKYLSDTLGKMTVQTIGRGESHGDNPGGATAGESVNYGETGRSLLNPDEVLTLGKDTAIVLHPESKPHYVRPDRLLEPANRLCPHEGQGAADVLEPAVAVRRQPVFQAGSGRGLTSALHPNHAASEDKPRHSCGTRQPLEVARINHWPAVSWYHRKSGKLPLRNTCKPWTV